MTKVRKENSDALEYVCPECGTVVDPDQERCPGCSAKFSKEENGDVLIEYEPDKDPPTVDEMLEAAINEVTVHPVEKVSYGRTAYLNAPETPKKVPKVKAVTSISEEVQTGPSHTALTAAIDEDLQVGPSIAEVFG
jgi:RNA polymerase subunit RPABC4/transcription elongation factor Spt4